MQKDHNKIDSANWQITSMTGLGRACFLIGSASFEIILKSLNQKGLDVKIRLPQEFLALEKDLYAKVREQFSRGRIELVLLSAPKNCEKDQIIFNAPLAREVLQQIKAYCQTSGDKSDVAIKDILHLNALFVETSGCEESTQALPIITEGLTSALNDLATSRKKEGSLLVRAVADHLAIISQEVSAINDSADEDSKSRFDALKGRLNDLFSGSEIAQDRLYQEAMLLVERSDFKEEIDRLSAHCVHFGLLCQSPEPKGRKLDFLCQEMLRESNTLLTKASKHSVIKKAIDLKARVERMREQVQNIE